MANRLIGMRFCLSAMIGALGLGCSEPDPVPADMPRVGRLTADKTAPEVAPGPSAGGTSEGLRAPSLHLSWDAVPSGVLSASASTITAILTNETQAAILGKVILVTSGLDGQLVQESLGTFNVPAKGTFRVPVAVKTIPLQSETSSSFVAVQAEFAYRDGNVVRPSTEPLYYHFQGGYKSAVFYSSNDMLFKHNGGAIGSGVPPVIGRIKAADGTWSSILNVEVAAAAGTSTVGQPAAARGILSGTTTANTVPIADFKSADRVAPTEFAAAAAVNHSVTICTTWRVQYVDAGFGEDALATSFWQDAPARYAYYEIIQNSSVFWQGFLNSAGCVTNQLPSGTYTFRQYTNNTRAWPSGTPLPNYINTFQVDEFDNANALSLSTFISVMASGTLDLRPPQNFDSIQVAAVAAQMLFSNATTSDGLGMKGYTLNVRAPRGCGPPVVPETDSCYKSSDDWTNIGRTIIPGTGGVNHSHWKSIIAHELGHHIQARAWGKLNLSYNDNATAEPLCRCDHYTTAWSNTDHCMNSREYFAAGEMEGYGHATATRAFNNDDSGGNAKFVYYKPFLGYFDDDFPTVRNPPSAFVLSAPNSSRWIANQCPAGANHEGNEYDWLTFYYSISVASIANPSTFNDIAAIYRRACTGSSATPCAGQDVYWSTLQSAALAYYGGSATNPKYVRFRDRASAAGVNY